MVLHLLKLYQLVLRHYLQSFYFLMGYRFSNNYSNKNNYGCILLLFLFEHLKDILSPAPWALSPLFSADSEKIFSFSHYPINGLKFGMVGFKAMICTVTYGDTCAASFALKP